MKVFENSIGTFFFICAITASCSSRPTPLKTMPPAIQGSNHSERIKCFAYSRLTRLPPLSWPKVAGKGIPLSIIQGQLAASNGGLAIKDDSSNIYIDWKESIVIEATEDWQPYFIKTKQNLIALQSIEGVSDDGPFKDHYYTMLPEESVPQTVNGNRYIGHSISLPASNLKAFDFVQETDDGILFVAYKNEVWLKPDQIIRREVILDKFTVFLLYSRKNQRQTFLLRSNSKKQLIHRHCKSAISLN